MGNESTDYSTNLIQIQNGDLRVLRVQIRIQDLYFTHGD